MLDPKDMRKITMDEIGKITFGVSFYIKDGDAFKRVVADKQELSDPMRMAMWRHDTKDFISKGLLYVKRNKPFEKMETKPWNV